jgi:hypothetical protein
MEAYAPAPSRRDAGKTRTYRYLTDPGFLTSRSVGYLRLRHAGALRREAGATPLPQAYIVA